MPLPVPGPRAPRSHDPARGLLRERIARFYEEDLGWPVQREEPDGPARLATGVVFDALELPARAGRAVVDRLDEAARADRAGCPAGPTGPVTGPVALSADRSRMWVLLAPGSADEVPGLLDWLEWGGIALDLDALGAGRSVPAPVPPRWPVLATQGAAVWLRPPGRVRGGRCGGHLDEESDGGASRSARPAPSGLPALRLCGGAGGIGTTEIGTGGSGGDAPDLVRLVDAAAAECHRIRLARGLARGIAAGANPQPLAFS
ncbi:SCO3374 family protein [Streptomyces sp. NBC_01497]|uniref:SCO3374 family protein n=1 Tax=Streptomyces sp. NBC_01497 TaxID=2903885 RepID=UPI002E36AF66|nr:SCO3374 family protein [Streptomyces sp. NBC_01497]